MIQDAIQIELYYHSCQIYSQFLWELRAPARRLVFQEQELHAPRLTIMLGNVRKMLGHNYQIIMSVTAFPNIFIPFLNIHTPIFF